jgi:hypothetical protein
MVMSRAFLTTSLADAAQLEGKTRNKAAIAKKSQVVREFDIPLDIAIPAEAQ